MSDDIFERSSSPYWQCWVRVITSTGERRRIARSTGVRVGDAKSRQLARINAQELQRTMSIRGEAATRPSKTLKQALRAVADAAELAERTWHTTEAIGYRAASLTEFFGDDRAMADIDADAVIAYCRQSRDKVRGKKRRTAFTVTRELGVLKQAFKVAGMVPPPFPELGGIEHKAQRVLEVDEQRALLLAAPAKRKLHILAYLQLGVRASELWKITEVDWEGRYVFVAGTKTKNSRRWVPVPDELYEAMLPLRDTWAGFPRAHQTNMDKTIKRAARRAGLQGDLSVNDLRGTYATHMARTIDSPLVLAKIMGTSIKMLEHVYAQVGERGDHLHEAVARGVPRLKAATKTTKGETGT